MYVFKVCPDGQQLTDISVSAGLVLHLRENRSYLPQEARAALTAMIVLFMALAIVPAMRGVYLVPLFSLGTMAFLVAALERHKFAPPAEEWLSIGQTGLRWVSNRHGHVDFPAPCFQFVQDDARSAYPRLLLKGQCQTVEIGRCLSLTEKREVAPLLKSALAQKAVLSA